MLSTIFWAIGLVLAVEGLVLALLPSRLDDLLRLIDRIPAEHRRLIGLAALSLGAVLASLGASLGGG